MAGAEYVGRFAPSPTGQLHFGSLIAALASYLDARAHGGRWLVRMEDVDEPRTRPGAAEQILRDLELFGFEWDGPVMYQTARTMAYENALERLRAADLVYPCACSRRETGGVYHGNCTNGLKPGQMARAWRLRVPTGAPIQFTDRIRGAFSQDVKADVGDYLLRRADGLFGYQLAVVVDDAAQDVTDVVRGADLLDNTPRQILLQGLLGLPTPRYAHIPIAKDERGRKLSKSTGAAALDHSNPAGELSRALQFLGMPQEATYGTVCELLRWAVAEWRYAS